ARRAGAPGVAMAPRPLIKGHPVDCVCWDCWAVVAKRVPAGTKGHPADCVCSRCWPDVEPRRAMPPRNLHKLSPPEQEEAIREYEEHKREWQDFRKQPQPPEVVFGREDLVRSASQMAQGIAW